MSYFTEEALEKFQEMCADGVDFGEGDPYDFTMCLMANGDIYGVEPGEQCERGKAISDEEARRVRKNKEDNTIAAQMAKLKQAFINKKGRNMNPQELKKAFLLVNKGKAPKE